MNIKIPVIVKSKKNIVGEIKKVLIKKFSQQTIYGTLIDKKTFLQLKYVKIENFDQTYSLKKS